MSQDEEQTITKDDVGTVDASSLVKQEKVATPEDINALMVAEGEGKYASDSALEVVTKVGDYLPYVQLMGGNSLEVKKGEFPMGHFCLRKSKSNLVDLSEEVVLFVIAVRSKAMQFTPEVLSFFDHTSEEFKKIQREADDANSGKGFGPEFLVWLPDADAFATYFMGNKTGRNEAPNLVGPLKAKGPFVCLQVATLIETSEYAWHGPRTKAYDVEIKRPPLEQFKVELTKFNNPPVSQKEVAEKDEDADAGRER